jgi:hypothetical protein
MASSTSEPAMNRRLMRRVTLARRESTKSFAFD